MKLYEIAYIADPEMSPEEASSLQERVVGVITEKGGTPGNNGSPQKRKLAYKVKKNGEAYFSSVEFSAEEDKIKEIEEEIRKESSILRRLLIKKPAIKKSQDSREKKKSLKPEKTKLQEIDKKIEEIV